jgi:3-oxoadipate enol-lactonase
VIVFCGSLGSTAEMWGPQLPVLGERQVVFVELPGHGRAALRDAPDLDALADAVCELVVDEPFTIVGLSLGGAVAMTVAARRPEAVEAVVLACTSARFGDRQQWLDRADTVRRAGLEPIVDAVLARWFTPDFDDVERWREMFLSVEPEGYARCCEALAGWDGSGDLRRIEAPTLVIGGSDDPTCPPAAAQEVAALVAHSRLAVIDGAQHLANVERPDEFNRLLEEYL